MRLSRYFGTTAQFWLNLQTEYKIDCITYAERTQEKHTFDFIKKGYTKPHVLLHEGRQMNKKRRTRLENLAKYRVTKALEYKVDPNIQDRILDATVATEEPLTQSTTEKEQQYKERAERWDKEYIEREMTPEPSTDEEKLFYARAEQHYTMIEAVKAVTALYKSIDIIFSIDPSAAAKLVEQQGGAFGITDVSLIPCIMEYLKENHIDVLREAVKNAEAARRTAEKDLKMRRKHKYRAGQVRQAYDLFKKIRGTDTPSLRQFKNWLAGKNVPDGFPGIDNLTKFLEWARNWDGPERKKAGKNIRGMSEEEIYHKRKR